MRAIVTCPRDGDRRPITAPRALGTLVVEVLDHHRLPIQRLVRRIGAGTTRFRFDPKAEGPLPTIRFQVGRWSGYSELHCMDGCGSARPSSATTRRAA